MTSILFVCLGNICRSPLAEGIARKIRTEKGLAISKVIDSYLKKDDAPQYTPNGDIFQLDYGNGLTVSMNKPGFRTGFNELVFTSPQPQSSEGGRRSRRRRYTKKIKQRSKRRVQKKRAATRAKRERKTRK